jgi:hypothetical protein
MNQQLTHLTTPKGNSMRSHTDSESITYNEDGSWTTKSEITTYPASRGQKAAAWTALGAICLLPVLPIAIVSFVEMVQAKKAENERLKLVEDHS